MDRLAQLKELVEERRQFALNNPGVRLTEGYRLLAEYDELELAELLPEEERSEYQKYILIVDKIPEDERTDIENSIVRMFEGEKDD